VALRPGAGGGRHEQRLGRETAERPCLSERELTQLHLLASQCEATLGQGQDIEWAFAGADLHLLQIRPMTAVSR
jgi:pyruvate,water dikinase